MASPKRPSVDNRHSDSPSLPPLHFEQSSFSDDVNLDVERNIAGLKQEQEDTKERHTASNNDDSTLHIISWNGPDDPENPLNWSMSRKWTATILVSCFTFISPFASTMVTPALDTISQDFGIPPGFQRALVMSIFLLGYAQGPFVLAPLSEIYGRVSVLQYANLIFLAFNTACGFAKSKEQMLAFRFLSGIGGSAPQALCNGVLADVWRKEERGLGQSIYGMLTFIGPCVAPIVGAYVTDSISWRWVFWVTSMFDVLVQLSALFFLRETYAPRILAKKAAALRKQDQKAEGDGKKRTILTQYDNPDKTFASIMRRRLVLPFIMLFAHPAVQVPSLYRAFFYGIQYLVLSTFQNLFRTKYHQPATTASLHYIALCIGFLIGLQISHPLMDGLYAWFSKRQKLQKQQEQQQQDNSTPFSFSSSTSPPSPPTNTNSTTKPTQHPDPNSSDDDSGLPEWRVPPMLISALLLCPLGLFLYGFTAARGLHWILPDLGAVFLAAGVIIAFQSAQAYVTDAYGSSHAASAGATGAFLRTMCGFSFPLFGDKLYDSLGLGWGNGLLGFLAIGIGVAGPVVLWFWGEGIRRRSRVGL